MQNSTELHFANTKMVAAIQGLLKSCDLPYTDIEKHIDNFVFIDDGNRLIGCVGLEVYGDFALLRSLAVDKEYQNQGWGKNLTKQILQYAQARHVKELYLLTTTAESFFQKLGFKTVNKNAAPEIIRSTGEFSSLCPSTAVLMYKEI